MRLGFIFVFMLFLLGQQKLLKAQVSEADYQEIGDFMDKDLYQEALEIVDSLIEVFPDQVTLYLLKGEAMLYLGQVQEVYDLLTWAIVAFPGHSGLYNMRGSLLLEVYMVEESIADFDKAMLFCTDDAERAMIYSNRGSAYLLLRDTNAGYQDLLSAVEIEPDNVGFLINLAHAYDNMDRIEEALKVLFHVIEVDSLNMGAYLNIGFIYGKIGEHEKAILYLDTSIAIFPAEAYAFSNRSYSKMKLGLLEDAMKDINKSIELNPMNSWAYRNKALIYKEMGKNKKMCEELENSLRLGFTENYSNEVKEMHEKYCNE